MTNDDDEIRDLKRQKESIKMLLESLEKAHKAGRIGNERYVLMKDKYSKKLEEIERNLAKKKTIKEEYEEIPYKEAPKKEKEEEKVVEKKVEEEESLVWKEGDEKFPFLQTDVDNLYHIIKDRKIVTLSKVAKELRVPKSKIEEWARILEDHKLITIHYPIIGSPIMKLKEKKKSKKTEIEEKLEKRPESGKKIFLIIFIILVIVAGIAYVNFNILQNLIFNQFFSTNQFYLLTLIIIIVVIIIVVAIIRKRRG
jgi:hypothetical protein